MSLTVNTSDALEQAKARQEAAQRAKEEAEAAKSAATTKDAEAAANAEKQTAEADAAAAIAEKEAAEVTAVQSKVNAANVRVTTAQSAYTNACTQLNSAQAQLSTAQASGDESAISAAESAVNSAKSAADRAYKELQSAQREADEVQKELVNAARDAEEAKKKAETEKTEAEQAKQASETAKAELESAETALNAATQELEAANAALAEAEAAEEAAKAESTEGTEATEGVEEAEHLSQEEIDNLVQNEGYTYITSQEQFLEIFQNGGIDLNGNYILGCDIDLSDIDDWQSVGDENNPFTGVFNGNGYSIDNLTINVEDSNAENVGFFGVTENATISNVSFNNANVITPDDFINGSSAVGIVVGTARGTSFDNINISGSVTGYESVGGLAGVINDNSYKVDGQTVSVSNSSISNVTTSIDAQGKYYVGGLVGYVEDTSTAEGVATRDLVISNCNTSGNIVFEEEAAGGLIGEAGKTVITITNSESNVNLTWDNTENDGDLSSLMETGRAGGFIGCANGTYIAICNSEYKGNLDVDGDFKGDWYGWYMNDAHVTVYEIPGGLPVDDILNIDGIDGLTPITDPETGVSHYEVTVSTLTGLDKMVTMLQQNPALADLITFNVNFDFEAMDGMYDPSVYEQYGVVQHLYEDEEGNVHNDVYIDNEIDLETTFHQGEAQQCNGNPVIVDCVELQETMVSGLYKNSEGEYVVNTYEGLKNVNMNFNYDGQITDVTRRLDSDEVRYREYITQMVQYYQNKMYDALKALFGLDEDASLPVINKAEYKKLQKMQEEGADLTDEQKLAMAVYEADYTVMNLVAETTHNYGCGMGGNASFLDETQAIQMVDDAGRPLFTTLNGDQLRQRMDADGNLMTDDEGNPIYENLDGSDYAGFAEVFAQRGYPVTDENGNFLYTDKDGNTITKSVDEDGNATYTNPDGSVYEGAEEDLKQQLDPYSISDEYESLENEMKELLSDVESGKYPTGRTSTPNETSESVTETTTEPTQSTTTEPTPETTTPEEENSTPATSTPKLEFQESTTVDNDKTVEITKNSEVSIDKLDDTDNKVNTPLRMPGIKASDFILKEKLGDKLI